MSKSKYIFIVSGLPRSGTSMMMNMLTEGGMEILTDNVRKADVDNPKGYYELEIVKNIRNDNSWLHASRGKAFKIVSELLYYLPDEHNYKVIFMRRHTDEILASQSKMLKTRTIDNNIEDEILGRAFNNAISRITRWLDSQKNIDTYYADYNKVLYDTENTVSNITKFVDLEMPIKKMISVIDPKLHRHKK